MRQCRIDRRMTAAGSSRPKTVTRALPARLSPPRWLLDHPDPRQPQARLQAALGLSAPRVAGNAALHHGQCWPAWHRALAAPTNPAWLLRAPDQGMQWCPGLPGALPAACATGPYEQATRGWGGQGSHAGLAWVVRGSCSCTRDAARGSAGAQPVHGQASPSHLPGRLHRGSWASGLLGRPTAPASTMGLASSARRGLCAPRTCCCFCQWRQPELRKRACTQSERTRLVATPGSFWSGAAPQGRSGWLKVQKQQG